MGHDKSRSAGLVPEDALASVLGDVVRQELAPIRSRLDRLEGLLDAASSEVHDIDGLGADDEALLSKAEAAKLLGTTTRTIDRLVRDHQLVFVRLGRHRRFRRRDIKAFTASRELAR